MEYCRSGGSKSRNGLFALNVLVLSGWFKRIRALLIWAGEGLGRIDGYIQPASSFQADVEIYRYNKPMVTNAGCLFMHIAAILSAPFTLHFTSSHHDVKQPARQEIPVDDRLFDLTYNEDCLLTLHLGRAIIATHSTCSTSYVTGRNHCNKRFSVTTTSTQTSLPIPPKTGPTQMNHSYRATTALSFNPL